MKRYPVRMVEGPVMPGFAGWVPLPGLIVYASNYSPTRRFVAHELMHVVQWKRHGILFPFIYFFQWVSAGFSYLNIKMEIEARQAETDQNFLYWADDVMREHGMVVPR